MSARIKNRESKQTDDKRIAGVERIDASPEDIARSMFKRPEPGKARSVKGCVFDKRGA